MDLAAGKIWRIWVFCWWLLGLGGGRLAWLYRYASDPVSAQESLEYAGPYSALSALVFLWCMTGVFMSYLTPRIRYRLASAYLVCMTFFLLVVVPFAVRGAFK